MEVAFRATINDFRRLWGINFKDLWGYLKMKHAENNGRRSMFHIEPEVIEQLDNNEHVAQLIDFMMNSDSPDGDLSKLNSWGRVHRSEGDTLVLIDFGLTNDVYQSYYA